MRKYLRVCVRIISTHLNVLFFVLYILMAITMMMMTTTAAAAQCFWQKPSDFLHFIDTLHTLKRDRWSYMNSLLCYCFGMLLTSFCIAYARLFWILIHIIFQFVLHTYDSHSTRLQSRRHSHCNIGPLFLLCMWTSEHMCAMRIHILMNSLRCFLAHFTCLSLSFHLTSIIYISWRAEVLLIWHECARAC